MCLFLRWRPKALYFSKCILVAACSWFRCGSYVRKKESDIFCYTNEGMSNSFLSGVCRWPSLVCRGPAWEKNRHNDALTKVNFLILIQNKKKQYHQQQSNNRPMTKGQDELVKVELWSKQIWCRTKPGTAENKTYNTIHIWTKGGDKSTGEHTELNEKFNFCRK